ncbi:MAG: KGK domain-containing protein [Xenococcaceae cyanobacterium]
MECNDYLNSCQIDDVLCLKNDKLFKIVKFQEACRAVIDGNLPKYLEEGLRPHGIEIIGKYPDSWFTNGVCCKILRAGSNGWQEGKLRLKVTLEFCPDEPEVNQPESPLDDIRQSIEQNQ